MGAVSQALYGSGRRRFRRAILVMVHLAAVAVFVTALLGAQGAVRDARFFAGRVAARSVELARERRAAQAHASTAATIASLDALKAQDDRLLAGFARQVERQRRDELFDAALAALNALFAAYQARGWLRDGGPRRESALAAG